jgi:hypothetical protein
MTKSKQAARREKVGMMGDLFGYLMLCCKSSFIKLVNADPQGGGGTVVPMLLGQPPAWLLTSTPWFTYLPIYLLLVPTGLAEYFHSTCPALLYNVGGALIDGITRGTSICALPSAIAAARLPATAWTTAVLGGVAMTGGGFLVQLMGLHQEDWRLSMPTILKGGVLNTLDFWGGMLGAIIYAALLRRTDELAPLSKLLGHVLPADLLVRQSPMSAHGGEMMVRDTARGLVVFFLASLFLARVITLAVLSPRPLLGQAKKMDKEEKEIVEAVLHEKVGAVQRGEGPATRARSRAGTPKKSPKVKSS